jgi:hypothetical protein
MPTKQPSPAVTPQSEAEALVVQHALAFYRDMKHHAKNAPFGEILSTVGKILEASKITQKYFYALYPQSALQPLWYFRYNKM